MTHHRNTVCEKFLARLEHDDVSRHQQCCGQIDKVALPDAPLEGDARSRGRVQEREVLTAPRDAL